MMSRYEVEFETRFSARHALRHYRGRTEPTHSHSFRLTVVVSTGRLDRSGVAVDFLVLKKLIESETARLRGKFLNDEVSEFLEGKLSPSAENIAATVFRRLEKKLPESVRLDCVKVGEAHGCSASFRR